MTIDKPTDFTKPVQTRGGRKARVLCTDRKHDDEPIIALVTDADGIEYVLHYRSDGRWHPDWANHRLDLINVPEVTMLYLPVWHKIFRVSWPCKNYEKARDATMCGEHSDVIIKLTYDDAGNYTAEPVVLYQEKDETT